MSILCAQKLSFVYGEGTPFRKDAVTDVDFSAEQGEIIGIIGHTGSGKSTLMQMLCGLLKPESGKVLLSGEDIFADPKNSRKYRFQIGMVFQYPEYQLFDETVAKDIAFGPRNMGLDEDEIKNRVAEAADLVGLKRTLLAKSPFDISGGEKRRAAIAGVIAMRPKVLILDEPTAGLDPSGRAMILEMIKNYNKKTGATVIFVSHNMEDVASLSHRVFVMNKGKNEAFGTPKEVFSQSERLISMGLGVPKVTHILYELKKRGFPVKDGIYTIDGAADEIARLLRERGESNA